MKKKSNMEVPNDVTREIIRKLPYKSQCRFRCVSFFWKDVIDSVKDYNVYTLIQKKDVIHPVFSLLDSSRELVLPLTNPFPSYLYEMKIVGSLDGIVCLCRPNWGDVITLWNPFESSFKFVQLSTNSKRHKHLASVAMAHTGTNIVIVRIILSSHKKVEILPTNSLHSKWISKKVDLQFELENQDSCGIIYSGQPYWIGIQHEKNREREIVLKFDGGTFKMTSYPIIFKEDRGKNYHKMLVNLYSHHMLGMLVWDDKPTSKIEVCGFDHNEQWIMLWTVSPPLEIDRILGMSVKGHIIVEYDDRILLIVSRGVHMGLAQCKIQIGDRRRELGMNGCFEILEIQRSTLIVEGMSTVEEKRWSHADIRDYVN
ncbi:F-box protein At1g52495-like [Solanum lycopersicum]|uniref:F-box protein At1g52495-like n=1 Tax=Solanum lycopersicum TaxID=4081 RepID=UPI0008FECDBB